MSTQVMLIVDEKGIGQAMIGAKWYKVEATYNEQESYGSKLRWQFSIMAIESINERDQLKKISLLESQLIDAKETLEEIRRQAAGEPEPDRDY